MKSLRLSWLGKGGSAAQLLAGNWPQEHHNGKWYTFHVVCNSLRESITAERMSVAIEKVVFAAIKPTLASAHGKSSA